MLSFGMYNSTVNTFPFGGIGHSGMYAYHGKHTFNAFSHMKPTLRSSTKLDFITKLVITTNIYQYPLLNIDG